MRCGFGERLAMVIGSRFGFKFGFRMGREVEVWGGVEFWEWDRSVEEYLGGFGAWWWGGIEEGVVGLGDQKYGRSIRKWVAVDRDGVEGKGVKKIKIKEKCN